jgi:hypothetical protein
MEGKTRWSADASLPLQGLKQTCACTPDSKLSFYSFLSAMFGGWDDDGMQELKRATDMSSLAKPIAYLVYGGAVLGARLSPLHGRFPIAIYSEAMAEARGLRAEKVRLV